MKRYGIILMLAVVLLLGGCAANTTAAETETVAETTEIVESVGSVIVDPLADGNNYMAPEGTDTISLYIKRENAKPGEGTMTLYTEDDTVVTVIEAGSDQVTFAPVTEEHKEYYGIDTGTEVHISLGFGLEAGTRYYVLLSEDFVRYEGVSSRELGGKEAWPIQVEE